ncbi:hypothetical protein S40293_08635 [Stachybotrys chartarum IBT 40293]|nr:hypothetical protein S40293_08635 [Stachybotrys chartarum IBT 40293]
MDLETHDPRAEELETLQAIYPEIHRPDPDAQPFTFELELPVEPANPITVTFPAATPAPLPSATAAAAASDQPARSGRLELDSLEVSHLPPLRLRLSLPAGYPLQSPPSVSLSTTPPWLSDETINKLQDDAPRLWDEAGRDMVAFTYIDHVYRAAEDVFGIIGSDGTLQVDPEHKLAVLDYDIQAKKAAFEKETFDCGVCLDPKKGTKCHKMMDCGHVFCLQCLIAFYDDAITAGSIDTVRCLTPNCAKERAEAQANDKGRHARKPKVSVSPSELLQIGLSEDAVKRYVNLKYIIELESDKNTIYCPRQWCDGAARSKKHKKPSGLDFVELSDSGSGSESDDDDDDHDDGSHAGADARGNKVKTMEKFDPADLLAVCEDCGLAFCSRCYQSWHGEFIRCHPKRSGDELTFAEKASLDYIKFYTSPCPTCTAPAQKMSGCNHMRCSRCDTHFCYLCSSWLDPGNPYQHYNEQPNGKVTSCYMRLWEDEGDTNGFGPQMIRRPEQMHANVVDPVPVIEEFGDSDSEPEDMDGHRPAANRALHENGHVAVDREAPLVLRIVDDQAAARRARRAVPPPAPEAPPVPVPGRGRNVPNRGGNRGGPAVRGGGVARGGGAARGRAGGPPQGRGGRGRGAQAGAVERQPGDADGNQARQEGGELDPAQQAWVRHFVQLALIDAEDEMEGNSDEEDDAGWRIR